MKKGLFLFIASCLLFSFVFGGDGDYAVSKIAPELLLKADAVLRLEEITFEIKSTKEAVERNHYVITIMNENGDHWADFLENYDKLHDINSIEGYLYDANGKQLKRIKMKDCEDLSGVGESNLIEDNRIKHHNFYYRVYPYTIEYDVVTKYNHTMFFPGWIPQGDEKLSVESSSFAVICPADYEFRYKAFNYMGDPKIVLDKDKKITSWGVRNMPALVREPNGPYLHELTTMVITGPTNFQFGDYRGNMSSWQDFGKFQFSLNQGRDILPDNVKQDIHRIADPITDVKKKIQVLYEYLQKNTRYISIQLGIGGWQPFDASYVAKKGYGDCKALSNYMYSILKEAGIRSNYTLIRAGEDENYMTTDFPSDQFDHVILSVPLEKDTVWLECTSQDLPAGYLSGFTSDRYALAVNENGGGLVHTPKYGLKENVEQRKITATLDEEATLTVHSESRYRALQQDRLDAIINGLSKDKVKELLHEEFDFGTYDINNFEYKEEKSSLPSIKETLDITVSNYATITGKRLFIIPNVMTRSNRRFVADAERKTDILLRKEYRDIDSVEISIPDGYEPESIPQPVSMETKFGKYSSSVKLQGNTIIYYRKMEQNSGKFSPKDYPDLVSFYDAIYKADRNKIVLVKKN